MKELDSCKPIVMKTKLQEFDLNFLNEDIVIPSISDVKTRVMPMSPPKPILPNQSFTRSSLGGLVQTSPRIVKDAMLERTITNIGSTHLETALQVKFSVFVGSVIQNLSSL